MMELHPAIAHFPVALISIAAVFAVISLFLKKEIFKEVAFWNLLLGVIGAIAAVLTGLMEEQNLVHNEEIHQVLVKHKYTGIGMMITSFALLTWMWVRKNKFRKGEYIIWVIFIVLGTAVISYQGFLGGKMVFDLGAGVRPMESLMEHEGGSTHSHSHSGPGSVHDHDHDHEHDNHHDSSSHDEINHEENRHAHSHSAIDHEHIQDTSDKIDSNQEKGEKKELKNMKY